MTEPLFPLFLWYFFLFTTIPALHCNSVGVEKLFSGKM